MTLRLAQDGSHALVLRLAGAHNACAYQGLWGKVQRLVGALGWALAHGHAVVFQQTDNWIGVGPGWCPEKSWLCFFQQVAPVCKHGDRQTEIAEWHEKHRVELGAEGFQPYGCLPATPKTDPKTATASLEQIQEHTSSATLGWSACMHDNLNRCKVTGTSAPPGIALDQHMNAFFGGDSYVPAEFRGDASERGGLTLAAWWESNLSRYLLRPRKFVLDYIERSKQAVDWPADERTSVLGVHVRRGDKYDNFLDVAVFAEYYLPHIQELVKRHSIRDVFVATDSPLVVKALRDGAFEAAADGARIRWIVFGKEQDQLPAFARFEDLQGDYSKAHWYRGLKGNERSTGNQFTANTLASIRDVWLLGQCHHFIGTRVSAVSRYSAMLLLGNRLAAEHGPQARETQIVWPEFPGIDRYR